jgi:uncharacterized protein YggE
LAAVKALGIEDKDIQTSSYNINPQMDYDNGSKITGYTVTNMVQVTVRNLDQTGEVLDKAVAAGANESGGIQFTVSDSSSYYNQALDMAIQFAGSKAPAVAKSLNVSVGAPSEVTEQGGGSSVVYNTAMKAAGVAYDSVASPIEAGDLTVSATIQAVYNY